MALGGPQHPPAQLPAAAAPHVPPQAWHALLESASGEDTVLLDVRNRYETRVGHFRKVCLLWGRLSKARISSEASHASERISLAMSYAVTSPLTGSACRSSCRTLECICFMN